MKLCRLLLVCSLIGLASCSPQNPAVAPDNSSAPKGQSSAATAQPSNSIVQHNGCTIDFVKVCQSFFDQPEFIINGDKFDWHRFQQSSSRHPDVEIVAPYPDSSVVVDIECNIDAQNRKIAWARVLPNPPLTDKAWTFAKSKRWCQEDSPDYGGWTEFWRNETAAGN